MGRFLNPGNSGFQRIIGAEVARRTHGKNICLDSGMFQNDSSCIETEDEVLTLLTHYELSYDEERETVRIPNEKISINMLIPSTM